MLLSGEWPALIDPRRLGHHVDHGRVVEHPNGLIRPTVESRRDRIYYDVVSTAKTEIMSAYSS